MFTTILIATLGIQGPVANRVSPASSTPAAVQITLKGSALIRGTEIRVGDLVTIDPAGPVADRIGNLIFGNPPSFGFVRRVTAYEIRNTIQGHRVDTSRLQFGGANSVSVTSTFREVRIDELREVADSVLTSMLERGPGEEIEFELSGRNAPIRVPPGRESLEFTARVRDNSVNQTNATVDVTFLVDGKPGKKVPLRYRLHRYHHVVKTSRSIRAGEPLNAGNLMVVREKVSATRGFWAADLAQIEGLVARRNMQRGAMVSVHDGREPSIIRKGQIIDVISKRGRIRVSMRAIALSDAARAENVHLRHLQSNKTFYATAYGPGTAVVGIPVPATRTRTGGR